MYLPDVAWLEWAMHAAWYAEDAVPLDRERLHGVAPDDLAGLCKLRVGDYRILYWVYPAKKLIRIYRVQHCSEIYRQL